MNDLEGQVLKGYEIQEHIGGGGFGDVYRAYQGLLKREVAIKIIRPEYANHPDFIRRFEAEAQMVARLEHLHIVPLYDYWREPGGAYLVMRWLRGGSLRSSLKEGAWSLEATVKLIEQISAALTVAHRLGVIHRDMKPDNVLLDEDGNAYLADFGIAKDLTAAEGTQNSVIMGSPDYLSPEQIEGQAVTPQTDIYSLGIIIYEMLVGARPFSETTLIALMNKHLNEPLPLVAETRPEIPDEVDDVIQQATSKNPEDRFEDAMSVARALRNAVYEAAGDTVTAPRTAKIEEDTELAQPAIEGEALISITPDLQNPYKGLQAFQAADSADFFGRDALIEQLMSRLREEGTAGRFMAVVGPSGSGKSSVVKAGMIPAIRRGEIPGSEDWYVREMTPGSHPFEKLETALLQIAVNPPPTLVEQLRADERGLLRAIGRVLPDDNSELLLIIDQFEEVFTQVDDETVRGQFLDSLLAAVSEPRSRLRLIITLRADFYDRPLLYSDFGLLFRDHTEVVLPLSDDELRQAIIEPARRVGLQLEPGLVEAIVADIGQETGALPLLQYALTELYERREGRLLTVSAYSAAGRAMGALARRADQIFLELDEDGQNAVRQLFLRLVIPGEGTEDTRRRVTQSEFTSLMVDESDLRNAIDVFGRYRLLTFDRDPVSREPTIEVAHEALIRTWERLRLWLDSSREDLRMQRLLMGKAEEWRRNGRDPSFLMLGNQLAQFQDWLENTEMALAQDERAYFEASIAERTRLENEIRQEEALKAQLKQRAVNILRALVGVLLVAVVIAAGLSIFAFDREGQAQDARETSVADAATAAAAQGTSEFNAEVAATQAAIATVAQGEALIQADAALAAQSTSEFSAALAETEAARATVAQGEALVQAETAVAAQSTSEFNAEQARSLALIGGVQQALNRQQPDLALALALEANRGANPPADAVEALINSATSSWIRDRFDYHTDWVWDVAFSADGRYAISGSRDRKIVLWDMVTGTVAHVFEGHKDVIRAVAFSPDMTQIASASLDKSIILWDVESGERLHILEGHTAEVWDVAYSPDGTQLASAGFDGAVRLWDTQSGTQIGTFDGHNGEVLTVTFSPDGEHLLSGSNDTTLILWDVETGDRLRTFTGHTDEVWDVAFTPDGNRIVSASFDGTLIMWDATTTARLRTLEGHTAAVLGLAFSPDGSQLLSGANDNTILLWDVLTGQPIRSLQGHTGAVPAVAFSPDGTTALTGSVDSTLILWDLTQPATLQTFDGHLDWVNDVAFFADGATALSASSDGTLLRWDVATGRIIQVYQERTDHSMLSVALSPDETTALSGTSDNLVLQWDIASGEILRTFEGHTGDVDDIAFSPDGRTALSASSDGTILLWNVETGLPIRSFEGHNGPVLSVAYHPTENTLLSGSFDGTLILWDLASGGIIRRYQGHVGAVQSIAFNADGSRILSGGEDTTLIIWDTATGEILNRLRGHTGAVESVTFSPDNALLLSAARDSSLMLWNAASGQPINRFTGHTDDVSEVRFSPDGWTALSASQDRRLILWNLDAFPGGLINWAQANRDLPELSCEDRERYGIEPACDTEGSFPTRTPAPTIAATNPAETPESAIPTTAANPEIEAQLALAGIGVDSGYVFSELDRHSLSVSDESTSIHWVGGYYDDFVIKTTISWGDPEISHACGFRFRQADFNNFYDLSIDLEGNLWLSNYLDSQWQDNIYGYGYAIQTGEDAKNDVMLAAIGNTFSIYINGEYVAQFRDSNHLIGRTALMAASFSQQGQDTNCGFEDTWVWELAYEAPQIAAPPPPSPVLEALAQIDIRPESGYLADWVDEEFIDLTGETFLYRWESFNGDYTDFVMGTEFQWGPGAAEDQCGFRFRAEDADNFYVVDINQNGELRFRPQFDNEWETTERGNGSFIVPGEGVTNKLILVAIDNTFTVYVNGNYAAQFSNNVLGNGGVYLLGGIDDESTESWCTFNNAWVWDLVEPPAPEPTPTVTPTFTPAPTATANPEILAKLDAIGITSESGYLVEEVDELTIDVTGEENLLRFNDFTGTHTDFVVSAVMAWGPGDTEDQCGFRFRSANDDDFYTANIDQNGNIWFNAKIDNVWQDILYGEDMTYNLGQGSANEVTLVVIGNTFTIFLNGAYAGQWTDDIIPSGEVALMAGTFDESDASWCTFTDAWLWDLAYGPLPANLVPDVTPSAAPSITPSPLPVSPTPMTVSPEINQTLLSLGINPADGNLVDQIIDYRIDLSEEENLIRTQFFDGEYQDFVIGMTAQWGPGATEDECGLRVRSLSGEDYYIVQINRDGELYFVPRIGGEWQSTVTGNGSAINTAADALNKLVLVGIGDTFTVYINDQLADSFTDAQIASGEAGVTAATYDESTTTWCDFSSAWAWSFASTPALVPGTPIPTVEGGGRTAQLGENRGTLKIGESHVWLYSGRQGESLTLSLNADNPAGNPDTQIPALDTVLAVRGPDGTTLAENDDARLGVITDSRIENLLLPSDGIYEIEVGSYNGESEGGYTLIIESAMGGDMASTLPDYVTNTLALLGYSETSGVLGENEAEVVIDLTNEDNIVRSELYDGQYGNFIAGTKFTWGPGATGDECGMRLRSTDGDNYHLLTLDRDGDVDWVPRVDGEWQRGTSGDGSSILVGLKDVNSLVVLVLGDQFTVYINGTRAGEFVDERLDLGEFGLAAVTYEGSDEAYCTFNDIFVWQLNDGAAVEPTATPTAAPASGVSDGSELLAQIGSNTGTLALGTYDAWTYTAEAGESLTISISADDPSALDTMLIVLQPDGGILAENDDIILGIDTNSRLEDLTFPVTGTYTIEVRSYNDNGSGGYTLTLDTNPGTGPDDVSGLPGPVARALTLAGVNPNAGSLVQQRAQQIIDVSDADNIIRSEFLDGSYADFIIGADVAWGPGASEDECGIRFRSVDDDNYYAITIDRDGDLVMLPRLDGAWHDTITGDGSAINRGENDMNTLVVVGSEGTFDVYLNGHYADQFRHAGLTTGQLGVVAATYENSAETSCTFTDIWVWEINPAGSTNPTTTPAANASLADKASG